MNVFHLKLIALTTMIIDHIGAVFFEDILLFRYIGRLAFPIYAFLISEGCKKTKNFEKYLYRLLLFSLLSEVFYDLIFYDRINFFSNTNTIFTLFFASLIIYIIKTKKEYNILQNLSIVLILCITELIQTDYGLWGIALVLIFYFFDTKFTCFIFASILIFFKDFDYSFYYFLHTGEIYKYNLIFNTMTLASLYFIYLYNGEKGKDTKMLFYYAYPLHFLILFIIKKFIFLA